MRTCHGMSLRGEEDFCRVVGSLHVATVWCSLNARGVSREGCSSHMQASCQLAQLVGNGCNGSPAV